MDKIKKLAEFSDAALVGVLSGLALLIYANSLPNSFIFDDYLLIVNNYWIQFGEIHWREMLLHSYRPFRTIFLTLLYPVFGLDYPWGYRLINIILHVLCTFIGFKVFSLLTGRRLLAAATALLFIVHPVHTDSVAYISGSRDLLFALFYLLAFYCFIRWRRGEGLKFGIGAFIAFMFSFLSKEMALSLPLICFLYDIIVNYPRERLPGRSGLIAAFRLSWLRYKLQYLFLLVLVWFVAYYYIFIKQASKLMSGKEILWWGGSWELNYLTLPKLVFFYFKKMFAPVALMSDYRFYPLAASSLTEPAAWLALLGLIVLIVLTIRLLSWDRNVTFGVFWFILTLLPVLHLLPHHEFIALHYLYLPAWGFSLALASGGATLIRERGTVFKYGAAALFLAALIVFASLTIVRNPELKNELIRTRIDIERLPESLRSRAQLGLLYTRMGLLASGYTEMQKAVNLRPDFADGLNNLGVLFSRLKEYETGNNYLRRAVYYGREEAGLNLAVNLAALGRPDEGRQAVLAYLKKRQDPGAYRIIGLIDRDAGQYQEAESWARREVKAQPANPEAWERLARALELQYQFSAAAEAYQTLLALAPENKEYRRRAGVNQANLARFKEWAALTDSGRNPQEGWPMLAGIALNLGRLQAAITFYQALEKLPAGLTPDDNRCYLQALESLGKLDAAYLAAARRAAEAAPANPETISRLARAYIYLLEPAAAKNLIFHSAAFPAAQREDFLKIIAQEEKYLRQKAAAVSPLAQAELRLDLGRLYLTMGNLQAAQEVFTQAAADPATRTQAAYQLGTLYLSRGKVTEARQWLKTAIKVDPRLADAYLQLSWLQVFQINNYEGGIYFLKKYLELAPQSAEAPRLQNILRILENYRDDILIRRQYMLKNDMTPLELFPQQSESGRVGF